MAPKKRFITCEICGYRSWRYNNEKRKFMAKFPLDADRCRQWVKFVGKEDLAYVPIEKLHTLKYVCESHFKAKAFNKKKNRLKKSSVPTVNLRAEPLPDELLFGFPCHINADYRKISQATSNKDTLSGQPQLMDHGYCLKEAQSLNQEDIITSDIILGENLLIEAVTDVAETISDENNDRVEFTWEKPSVECDMEDVSGAGGAEEIVTLLLETGEPSLITYTCNLCGENITGCRFVCCECAATEVCARCESSHASHLMLRVPSFSSQEQVRRVMAAVRRALHASPAHCDLNDILKVEVKDELADSIMNTQTHETLIATEDKGTNTNAEFVTVPMVTNEQEPNAAGLRQNTRFKVPLEMETVASINSNSVAKITKQKGPKQIMKHSKEHDTHSWTEDTLESRIGHDISELTYNKYLLKHKRNSSGDAVATENALDIEITTSKKPHKRKKKFETRVERNKDTKTASHHRDKHKIDLKNVCVQLSKLCVNENLITVLESNQFVKIEVEGQWLSVQSSDLLKLIETEHVMLKADCGESTPTDELYDDYKSVYKDACDPLRLGLKKIEKTLPPSKVRIRKMKDVPQVEEYTDIEFLDPEALVLDSEQCVVTPSRDVISGVGTAVLERDEFINNKRQQYRTH